MTYTIRLVANAQRDIAEIEKYYDENVPHETERCIEAVQAALDWIVHHAHQPPVSRFGLRRVSTETFRYYVWYRVSTTSSSCRSSRSCIIVAETTPWLSGCLEQAVQPPGESSAAVIIP